MGESDLGGKLEILEIDFKTHSCFYRKVSTGSDQGIKEDFFLRFGIEQITSSTTASVTDEIKVGETSVPYISSRWL